ncbi:MAG: hypothetical protein AAF335_03260 [Bacteroidota bacterium]
MKQGLIALTFLVVVGGSTFFYFRYGNGKEGGKIPEKPLKDWEKDDLTEFIDTSGVGNEAKRKELKKKIKEKDVTEKQLDELPTQEIIDQLKLSDEYAPLLEELKQKLKKEEQEDDEIKEEPKLLFAIQTQEELIEWINSLKTLTKAQKEGLLKEIKNKEIDGEAFLTFTSQQSIEKNLQVDSTTAKKLYDALIKLKPPPKVGPNSGLIGLENFNGDEANICYLNAAVQLLLQNPPLVKALRERQYFKKNKYVTKKENDPEQDMWAGFVELAQQAIQPNAQQAPFNPTYIATQLRKYNEEFKKDEIYDAYSAFLNMIEILAENFLRRMGTNIKVDKGPW